MARRRRMGLPAPLWIGRESRTRRKRRSPIILSLALHSLLAALAVLFLSTANTRHERIDTVDLLRDNARKTVESLCP